jgi:tRNA-Thr(GGU) m(6)t(6)A37 methyltransferase TsaA
MEKQMINPIGRIIVRDDETIIKLEKEFIPALSGLDGFGYIQVIWWFDGCDNADSRSKLMEKKPYKNGPDTLGIFATRAPERPNPIALTAVYVTYVDYDNGIIGLAYIDANDGSPVLDIKPYTPSLDRVEAIAVPDWCANWPKCVEESGKFDWENEFNF